MIQLLKSQLDKFLGRGDAAVTVPPLDGALKPNNLLEEAAPGVKGEQPDNLVLMNNIPLWSDGSNILKGPDGALWSELSSPVTALAVSDQTLVAALMDGGLTLLNPDGQVIRHIASPLLKGITALAIKETTQLFATVGSTRNGLNEWQKDLLELRASGMLLSVDLNQDKVSVVLDRLAYPSGVLPLANGHLLVSEAWKSRLVEIDPVAKKLVPVLEDLAAYPGRLVASEAGGFWLSCFAPRSPLIEFVLREPAYRKAMMAEVDPEFWIAPALRSGYSFHEPLQGGALKQMGILKPWAPTRSYGLVVEMSDRFVPVRSLHSRAGGKRHGVTSALPLGGSLLVTSKGGGEMITLDLVAIEAAKEA